MRKIFLLLLLTLVMCRNANSAKEGMLTESANKEKELNNFEKKNEEEYVFHKKNDLEKLGLKGKVKHLELINYILEDRFGELQKVKIQDRYNLFFNENGYITKADTISLDINHHYISIEAFLENRYNNIYASFQYDDMNNLIEAKYTKYKENYLYDDKKNNIEINRFYENKYKNSKIKRKYNNKNLLISANNYRAEDGIFLQGRKYEYNNKGDIIKEEQYDRENQSDYLSLTSYYTYKYEKNGNIIEKIEYQQRGTGPKLIEGIAEYSYNQENNISYSCVKEYFLGDPTSVSYINYANYKYDAKGNWVERREEYFFNWASGKKQKTGDGIVERIIEYY